MSLAADETVARSHVARGKSFQAWMEQPTTAMILSDIPENERLLPLIKAAFEAGHSSGQVFAIVEFMPLSMGRDRRF